MLSCFSDIADIAENSFQNTNDGNKLSKVVKLMERWIMDALKRDKIDKVFLCSDISHEGSLST